MICDIWWKRNIWCKMRSRKMSDKHCSRQDLQKLFYTLHQTSADLVNLASLVIIEKFSAVIQWFLCHSVILVLRNALNFQLYIWFQVTGWLLTLLGKFVSLLAPPPSTAQPFNYIPDICHFFYTGSIFEFQILHPKID